MEDIIQEISGLIRKKMKEQGVYDRDGYRSLVDEAVGYFLSKGKLTDDDNLEFIEDRLMSLYAEACGDLSSE